MTHPAALTPQRHEPGPRERQAKCFSRVAPLVTEIWAQSFLARDNYGFAKIPRGSLRETEEGQAGCPFCRQAVLPVCSICGRHTVLAHVQWMGSRQPQPQDTHIISKRPFLLRSSPRGFSTLNTSFSILVVQVPSLLK